MTSGDGRGKEVAGKVDVGKVAEKVVKNVSKDHQWACVWDMMLTWTAVQLSPLVWRGQVDVSATSTSLIKPSALPWPHADKSEGDTDAG
jgi:hypothetical protein